jgi:hypothetical protein
MRSLKRWRWGLIVALAMTILALYPQFDLWHARGHEWKGSYAFFDTDEVAYSAYLQALIDGRPRRNDPYTGRDDQPSAPQPESFFSIQFIPPYALALVGRAFNLSASTLFIILIALAAFLSALSIFWLIVSVTDDERLAATGALVALCLGILANTQGAARIFFINDASYTYLPFLRRYIPGLAFSFYFIFCALVWRALTNHDKRRALRSCVLAGLSFGVLVFSYFYLWTAAAAWLACLALLWLVARPEGWRDGLKRLAVIGGLALAALAPYFLLLSNRAPTMDAVQGLTPTRMPDLFRPPEVLGFVMLAALLWGIRRGRVQWRVHEVLFTTSIALMTFVVFNQQVVTGRLLQPLHYEQFIANYAALVGAVLTVWLIRRGSQAEAPRRISSRALVVIACASLCWGLIETKKGSDIILPYNLVRDDIWNVAYRLRQIETNSNAVGALPSVQPVVLTPNMIHADSLPTVAPQAVLWAPHMHVFSGVGLAENKERFYQHLYYTGVKEQEFAEALNTEHFYYNLAIFGWERANPVLALNPKPITQAERETELRLYVEYVASFNRERAVRPTLTYFVKRTDEAQDLTNLERWYEPGEGERVGEFTLYRLKLRP